MKSFLITLACFLTITVFGQTAYWQQQVNFKINVTLNDQNHSLKGVKEIEYNQQFRVRTPYFDLLKKKGGL